MKINWRYCIFKSLIAIAAILIPILLLNHKSLDSYGIFKLGAVCACIFPAVVGQQLLRLGQHQQTAQTFVIVLVMLFIPLLTKSVNGASADLLYFLIVAGVAGMLPVALFLNRSKRA